MLISLYPLSAKGTMTAAAAAVLLAVGGGGPAVAATHSTAAAAAVARPAVEVCGQGAALVRPSSIVLTCADDGELAVNLRWTSWAGTRATAAGNVAWRACATACADSRHWDRTSADVVLTDPVRERGKGILFTRLELHVTGSTPRGFQRDLAFDEAPAPAAALPSSSRPSARSRSLGPLTAPSGTLAYARIEGFWVVAGGPTSSQGGNTDPQIAAAITGAESAFLPGIIQSGVDYCGAGPDRAGWGLWQITCGNSVPAYGTDFQLLDPWNNAEAAVSKCNGDLQAGDSCFAPWSTYTSGAYTQYLQNTAPDTQLTDPGEYVQVNATPPGTPASPGADPGSTFGPPMPGTSTTVGVSAVLDNINGNLEVYRTPSGGGNLEENYWKSGTGWSGWVSRGSPTVTGSPSAAYNPVSGNLEVYATATDGTLREFYWNATAGWRSQSLGGDITGSPSAVFNPVSGSLEVYATGTGHDLREDYWHSGSGWSGWKSLGGDISGSPSAVYDPLNKNLEVYAHSAAGALWEAYWSTASGWSSQNLGGSIAGSPDAVYDPAGGNLEVYAVKSGGALEEYYWNATAGWRSQSLGGSVTGTPSAVYDTFSKHLEVYAKGTGGSLEEIYWRSGTGWSGWQSLSGSLTGSPSAVNNPGSGNFEVYAPAGHSVYEAWWNSTAGWQHQSL